MASRILHFPTVMGADVPVYNIPGVTRAAQLHAARRWRESSSARSPSGTTRSSPRPIRASSCPAADIVVVHRSDGSGTTYIWIDYLSKVSKEWEMKVGRGTSVNWPVGLGGKGNEGVSGQVKQTPNSIGYVELIYAVQNKMTYRQGQERGRQLRRGQPGGCNGGGGERQGHAGRFPRLHHQRSRQGRLSDLQLHLAADSREDRRTPPRRKPSRTSSLGC